MKIHAGLAVSADAVADAAQEFTPLTELGEIIDEQRKSINLISLNRKASLRASRFLSWCRSFRGSLIPVFYIGSENIESERNDGVERQTVLQG